MTESMESGARVARRSILPGGLIGMLVLVLCAEWFVSRHELDLTGNEAWDWSRSGRAVYRDGPANEILCFGSSVSSNGILATVIQQQSGRRVINFAICYGPPPASFFLLRRALDSGAKPAAILVDFHPGVLGTPPRHTMGYWSSLLTSRECLELSWSARDASFFAENLLAIHLPSGRNRYFIRDAIKAALRGESASQKEIILAIQRNRQLNKGTLLLHEVEAYDGEFPEFYRVQLLTNGWAPNRVSAFYARRLVELAASHQVPVFWVIPPFAPRFQQEREAKGLEALYSRYARKMLDRYPNLTVVDARRSGYIVPAFRDAGHLSRRGAITFSSDLADVLRARLSGTRGGPRWVDLPPFRDRDSAVPLENLAQSIEQLQLGTIRR